MSTDPSDLLPPTALPDLQTDDAEHDSYASGGFVPPGSTVLLDGGWTIEQAQAFLDTEDLLDEISEPPLPYLDPDAEIREERFQRMAQDADVWLRRLAGAQRRLSALDSRFEAELQRIREKHQRDRLALANRVTSIETALRQIGEAMLRTDSRFRTHRGPHGDLTIRVGEKPRSVKVDDEDAALAWADEHYRPAIVETFKAANLPPVRWEEAPAVGDGKRRWTPLFQTGEPGQEWEPIPGCYGETSTTITPHAV